jgi:hypothetical protein
MFEGVAYSMPAEATHMAGTVFLYEQQLRIVAGRFQVSHRRRKKGEPKAPLPEHRASKIAAVHGKRAKLYERRQQLLDLGPAALEVLTEITHREPRLSSRRIEELHAMLDEHGDERLRAAFEHAFDTGTMTVAGVRRALALGARGREGHGPLVRAAQPRGRQRSAEVSRGGRAEPGGAS